MTAPVIPSRNPAIDGDMGGTFGLIHRKLMQRVDSQLPAIVESYDRTTNIATVRPLISILLTNGDTVSRAPVASVPVLALGGGGFVINFPVKPGDMGWIEASDRDISLYMQAGEEAKPNTNRMHSFEDGRFVPDAFAAYSIATPDNASMVIQSYDGTTCIALAPGKITLRAAAVEIDCTTFTNNVSGVATTTAASIIDNGPVTAPNGITINGIPFVSHKHTDVQHGTDTSGGPTS